jgi:molybdopterin molybdotransferase
MLPQERTADWITVAEAVERILARAEPMERETVSLDRAVGRSLAVGVVSSIDQPPWDNSAMDGFAVRSEDVRGATAGRPATLRVIESVPAGGFPSLPVGRGQATRIMTGAPVPADADGIVRLEHVRDGGDVIDILDDSDAGRNIRRRGEDIRAGAVVLEPGRALRPAEIGVLASIGCARVEVHRAPRVAILATGDELVDLDRFDEARSGRRIVNSNSYGLAAAVRATGCEPIMLGIARDDRDSLRERLAAGLSADVLVSTAGASVGEHDLVKHALDELGFELDFWRVQMRPGSPFSYGLLPRDGSTALPVFGLPGNPVSALVTFEILVRPALRRMLGRDDCFTPTVRVRAAADIRSKPGLVHFLRVALHREDGEWRARLTGPQGSGILTSMARADALIVVPLDSDGVPAGAEATAVLLHSADPGQKVLGF